MNIFSQKSDTFGLDFSDLSLKVAKLRARQKRLILSCFGEIEVPPGIIISGEVQNERALEEIIRKALRGVTGETLTTKNVVCSLPEEKSFIDILQLPIIPKDKLKSAIQLEVGNHIPIPLGDVYFDFKLLEQSPEAKNIEALVAVTPKKIVDSYLVALKAVGLRPVVMEVESLAIGRVLIGPELKSQRVLIIDFGGSRTSFIIFFNKSLRFTSTIPISSFELTEAIAKDLQVGLPEAENLKRQEGLCGKPEVAQAITPLLNDLVGQIKTHLEYFASSAQYPSASGYCVERILLCGGGANLKGLVNFLSRGLSVQVGLGNPWINILGADFKEVPILPFEQSLGYTTALGLALRGATQ